MRKTTCLPDRSPLRQGRMQGRGRLPGARRRLGEQVLSLSHGGLDRFHESLLDRPRRVVRKGEPVGGEGLPPPDDLLSPPDPEQAREAALDVPFGFVGVRNVDGHLFARLDVDVDERARDDRVAEPAPEVAVGGELPTVALEGVSRGPDAVDGQIRGFELLDQPAAGFRLEAAVQAAGQDGGPVLDGNSGL